MTPGRRPASGMIDVMEVIVLVAVALWWIAGAITAGILATDRYLNGVAYLCIGLFFLGPLTIAVVLLSAPGQPSRPD